jgi:type IV secretory pathway VirB10-like protein
LLREEPKFSPRIEITVISNAVADSLLKNHTETKLESPSNDSPKSDVKDTTAASPKTETKPDEPTQPTTTANTIATLEPETPSIRPPSRYGMDIPESEKIDRSIRQAMWRTYRKTDIEENSTQSNQSDQSDYSSMEQLKDSSRNSNASQTSQTSQTSQVSDSKSQNSSVDAEDQKRVWVKVNTEGMGSSRYTTYQIEILVKGKSITGWKRYSEIRTLYDTLHSSVKSLFGRFPSKTTNKMDTMVIYTRQQYFLKFFTKLVEINQDGVVKFLESESS